MKRILPILFVIVSCGKELALQQGTKVHSAGTTHACQVAVSGIGNVACYNFAVKKDLSSSLKSFCENEVRQAEQQSLNGAMPGYTVSTSYQQGDCQPNGIYSQGYCLAMLSEIDSKIYFYTSDGSVAQSACNAVAQVNTAYSWVSNNGGSYTLHSTRRVKPTKEQSYKDVKFSSGLSEIIKSK